MLRSFLIMVLMAALAGPTMAAESPSDGGTINIMKPEKGAPPDKKTPRKARRGSSNPVYPVPLPGPQKPAALPRIDTARPQPRTPPDLYVPQTGRMVPNQPAVGSGPGGAETFQDRSSRCINQAGVNSGIAGDRGSYIRGCINQ